MKRWAIFLVCVLFLLGCAPGEDALEPGLRLRQQLLEGDGCTFRATVTADYGSYLHTFVIDCQEDRDGELLFQVIAPDTIAGITGSLTADQGRLTFDGEVLAFSPLADGLLAPVSAPRTFTQTLRRGYLVSCGEIDTGFVLSINDSYADNALRLEICLNREERPVSAEIYWQGRRILSMQIEDFQIL